MWTRQFWLDLIERAVKTFAQTLLAAVSADAAVADVRLPISAKLAAAGIAAGISALTSLVGTGLGAPDSGSWLPQSQDPPQPTAQDGGTTTANRGRHRRRGDAGYGLVETAVALVLFALAVYIIVAIVGR